MTLTSSSVTYREMGMSWLIRIMKRRNCTRTAPPPGAKSGNTLQAEHHLLWHGGGERAKVGWVGGDKEKGGGGKGVGGRRGGGEG